MQANVIGIDLAKNLFQVCATDKGGRQLWQRRISRQNFPRFLAEQVGSTIAMESCGGAHFIGRQALALGFAVRLIPPQFVKPYVKSQKNDYRDAEAICEAAVRPHMRFVQVKTIDEQDIQSVHRYRELLMSQRTMVINHARGILLEYGVVIRKGAKGFRKALAEALETKLITELLRQQIDLITEQLIELEKKIKQCESQLDRVSAQYPLCKMLQKLPGVGKLTSTALLTVASQVKSLKNGREFSASLGLIPRQNSTGGKTILLGITKRGDGYLRKLLVHGARAALRWVDDKTDSTSVWASRVLERRGRNRAAVALANKNARVLWAIMTKQENFVW